MVEVAGALEVVEVAIAVTLAAGPVAPRPPTVMKPAWGLLEKEARVVALGFVVVLMTSADLVSVDCDRWDKGLGLAVIAGLDLGLGLGLGSGFGSEVIRVLRLLEAAGTWLLSYPGEGSS